MKEYDNTDISRYADILDLPHHVSETRPAMSLHDRAAQFAPFAALTGYDDAIAEADRLTEGRAELTEEAKAEIDARLQALREELRSRPEVTLTVFRADKRKKGGAYITLRGRVLRLSEEEQTLTMEDGTKIGFENIIKVEI